MESPGMQKGLLEEGIPKLKGGDVQKLIKGRGREENPRQDGKRQEDKEAEDLKDRIGSQKVPLEQEPEESRGTPCPLVKKKGSAASGKALMQMHAWQQVGSSRGI